MMEKLSEIEILTVNGKKQYMCTSEIWEIADKVNEIVDYINKKENNSDKDHRIAVLERALELACKNLEERDLNLQPFKKYRRTCKQYIKEYIDQAEKELKEENK